MLAAPWKLAIDRFNPRTKLREGRAAFRIGILLGGLWGFNELVIEPVLAYTIACALKKPYLAIVLYPFVHLEYIAVAFVVAFARLRRRWMIG
jgi:hypothetical protein